MLPYYQIRVKEYMFYFEMIYFASSVITKLAMAIMILRLSATRRYTYIIWGNMAVLSVNAFVCLVIMFVSCSPIPALWNEKLYVVIPLIFIYVLADTQYQVVIVVSKMAGSSLAMQALSSWPWWTGHAQSRHSSCYGIFRCQSEGR